MDWVKQLNESINYIEENLTGEISYETISKIAGCSVYNFQRMFSYIADKPLSEYIRSRRLTMAAFDLLNCTEKIIDIALKYGYESQDAFTRAFKNFHGVLPSSVKNETVQLKSCPKLSFQITIKGVNHMNYQIEQWPAFKVMGILHKVKTSKAFKVIPKIWENAWEDGTMNRFIENFPDYRPAGFLGIAAGGQWGDSEEMNYILAVTSHVDVPECKHITAHDGMQEFSYPEATWAIFEVNGELPSAIQKVYKQFYTEWLPNSGYKLADLPVIECYMQENRQEVWIAVVKK
ncbi:transcriptional regulator, AraC family [Schinkia azotoformans MEV2011]|uniref:Transcriptional regulator, AraC family n=1 Tax=Schinkia azotoformans MEV2011 TaxID=1348973 RepID=A0A072NHA6_SCHAZ|nr:AraC family transcriptional regulator [Schinkia azotoformans]KEF36921.1 transcriptional regulator, AraC family [Schinkia azotoformans MEV2011]MEC1695994.1 AraC family transcriptional regulator [Schinkia azotoformans]MEC1724511.1 AraC family transcriptional regulator [Schinkia azotoformans]MEC1773407.1 AraC family transcriptional regulator [Schinkia azotoformans]MED4366098.1 AraC family transcriptional regulator [Schinkia azotoformans]